MATTSTLNKDKKKRNETRPSTEKDKKKQETRSNLCLIQ
jgi:hypothetical protein